MPDIIEQTISPSATSDAPVLDNQPDPAGEAASQDAKHGESSTPEPSGAAETDSEADEAEGADGDDSAGDAQPKRKGLQKRIDELVRKEKEAKREAEELRRQLAERDQPKPDQAQGQAKDQGERFPTPKPEIKDFETYEAFTEALTDWKADERDWKREQAKAADRAKEAAASTAERVAKTIEAAKEKFTDFAEVFHDKLPVTPVMADALMESEASADIAYYLGKNPEEAARIAGLSPVAQIREIGKIEARLEAQAKAAPKATPRTVSAAPAPVKPVGSSEKVEKDPNEMSIEEYEAFRRKKK
jgi:hypothetical protein